MLKFGPFFYVHPIYENNIQETATIHKSVNILPTIREISLEKKGNEIGQKHHPEKVMMNWSNTFRMLLPHYVLSLK
jgi:hypothetical protein